MSFTKSPTKRAIVAGIILSFVGALCTFLVLKAEKETKDLISYNKEIKNEKILNSMLSPNIVEGSTFKCKTITKKGIGNRMNIYIATKNNKNVGYIFNYTTSKGYSNPLVLIAGLDKNFVVHNVDIVVTNETPGIGDKVERKKGNFLDMFKGKTLENSKWEVKKFQGDFDYITGATVTSRAIVLATYDLLKNVKDIDFDSLKDCKGKK